MVVPGPRCEAVRAADETVVRDSVFIDVGAAGLACLDSVCGVVG